ncbi:MAG: S41 family peptidase [Pirellulales bacterium]|nr:S41 family peptidase [Pirellulales bacterium]
MRRLSTGLRYAMLAVLVLFGTLSASAQFPTTLAISPHTQQLDGFLQQGQKLELERRWGDALSYYEDALRQFPGDDNLQRRYDAARLHYDLQRRYVDRSFSNDLRRLSVDQTLELYDQVLLKIEAHYVDSQDWKTLFEWGTGDLEVAFSEAMFLERNVSESRRPAAVAFRRELEQYVGRISPRDRTEVRQAVRAVAGLAQARLGIPPTAVVLEYLCGATNSLDPYSAFLTPNQLSEVYSQIEGNFVGLGVELKAQNNQLVILRVIAGSPAERSGLRPGDRILAVDGRSAAAMSCDQAANMLQGEEGTSVALTVAGADHRPREVEVLRRRVEVPSVDQTALVDRQRGIGYLKLTCFQKTTSRDLDAALWKLHRAGMRSLIVDVRGNPGGLLTAAVDAADRFLERGVIVSTRGRSAPEDATFVAQAEGTWQMPLVVIIDQDSASAAEIFAGAIHELHRGTVVGTRSYGKGSVQGIFPLEGTSAGIRLTTAKFYSPNGRSYHRSGVEPDVQVRQAARPVGGPIVLPTDEQQDPMLAAALEVARGFASPPLQARSSR